MEVKGPAIGLIVVGVLGLVFALFSMLSYGLGFGTAAIPGGLGDEYGGLYRQLSGGFGIVASLIALAIYGFVVYAGNEMRSLRRWTLAMVASVVVMLPCSLCCIIGIPIGIWSIVVLQRPHVKAAFTG